MNVLFVHQNFPGQFKFLAPALAARGHSVTAMTMQKMQPGLWNGVRVIPYSANRASTPGIHPWMVDLETKTIRGEACFRAALRLREQGLKPDVIVAHPGWGESMFLKDAWPQARMGIYCEFFYREHGADSGFDPEFSTHDPGEPCRLRMKNLNNMLHFEAADGGVSPTQWQASTFPEPFRSTITVVHDGIDTQAVAPDAKATLQLPGGGALGRGDEVVTFVNRNMEPYRGFHIFMRALPELLKARPKARVVIVGADGVSYGARPGDGRSWKDIFTAEVRGRIPDADWARVHFIGTLAYPQFLKLLQVSTVHVYLTYPFVLSWSLLEAMSSGCAIVGSATAPVQEVIEHDVTGRLVDFFDGAALVREVSALCDSPAERARLGAAARELAVSRYDLQRVCLPQQVAWVDSLSRA